MSDCFRRTKMLFARCALKNKKLYHSRVYGRFPSHIFLPGHLPSGYHSLQVNKHANNIKLWLGFGIELTSVYHRRSGVVMFSVASVCMSVCM